MRHLLVDLLECRGKFPKGHTSALRLFIPLALWLVAGNSLRIEEEVHVAELVEDVVEAQMIILSETPYSCPWAVVSLPTSFVGFVIAVLLREVVSIKSSPMFALSSTLTRAIERSETVEVWIMVSAILRRSSSLSRFAPVMNVARICA